MSALARYEPSLDGMRGVCIAAVVAFHSCAQAGLHGWVRGGFTGVSVFFTLSGFLITSLLLRERDSTGHIDLAQFWARRIRRLWPASFAVVLAVVLLSVSGPLTVRSSDAIAATWNVTNWHVIAAGQGRLLQTIVGPLGPTWSLAVEEQFYVVLALLLAVVFLSRNPRRVLAVVAGLGVVVPIVLANVVTDWQPSLEFNTVLRTPELFAGVLLALWHTGRADAPRRTAQGDAAAGLGLVALLACFLFVDYSPPWLLRGGYTVVAAVTAVTIAGLLQRGAVASALAVAPVRLLGVVSYSLYLVHWPVMSVLTRDRTDLHGLPLVALHVGVALAAAVVLHLAVERPLRRVQTTPARTFVAGGAVAAGLTVLSLVVL